MTLDATRIAYPRRRAVRATLRLAGRVLLALLSRTTIVGIENVPTEGRLIVVGNHVAALEVVLMMLVLGRQVEFMGSDDIPPPPFMDAITRLYGFIPVFRGKVDRSAMEQALGVLDQGGVLGVFPEGGIWRTGFKRARKGVAWLSHRAQAPILPIGFGGMEGALADMFRLRWPRLVVRIGSPMAPVTLNPDLARRECLEQAAEAVMARVASLLPPEDGPGVSELAEERFALDVSAVNAMGAIVKVPMNLQVVHGSALSRLLYHPNLTGALRGRLKLPLQPLERLEAVRDPAAIARAAAALVQYLDGENPYLLTYRFGNREGGAMRDGLCELLSLAGWARDSGVTLSIVPIRRCRRRNEVAWIEQRSVGAAHPW